MRAIAQLVDEKMPYSEFTLHRVKKTFNLVTVEEPNLFASTPKLKCSEYLAETLRYNVPLALASNSEKARSEMIIASILIGISKKLNSQISLFSGVDFTLDPEQSLNGYCGFIISSSSKKLFVSAPVMMLVEAKSENIRGGLGQCIAEMWAAQLFNEREENNILDIYRAVTSGAVWQFLKLSDLVVEIDLREYYLENVDRILGILTESLRKAGLQKF